MTLFVACNLTPRAKKKSFKPLAYNVADKMADSVLTLMTQEEKIAYVGGDRNFFIRPIPRLHLKEVYMADATQGVHLRSKFRDVDLSKYQLEKSTAFPCPVLLASTWNKKLAYDYAQAVGEECRAGGVGILLGPGMNSYRQSQCGRNFEYFGEDPCLAAHMIENYVQGVQSTGTIATLKHFVANNTDYFRRKSNSIVDERSLHEIYLPAFKAGVDAGAKAVMTSYNLLNGEWCGESASVINDLLRKQLGYKWMVMTDWWSVSNGEKLAKSGQDLEMPYAVALKDAKQLIDSGKVKMDDIDRMAKSILRTYFAMKQNESIKDATLLQYFPDHERTALQTACEGIVLLKNEDNILPIKNSSQSILLTGDYVEQLAMGGGSAKVEGYNNKIMLDELKAQFGEQLAYVKSPTIDQIKAADIVLCNVGTSDSEGWDRPFALPSDQEQKALACVNNNPNTVVIVTSGSGIRMTDWSDKAKAILYAWYGGQTGNTALAEIISGKVNPSGKLPITIEKEFRDSPGYGYIPKGEALYSDWNNEAERQRSVYDVRYVEGVFTGYRWYESKNIDPLFPFGHGLSYTSFEYSDINVSTPTFSQADTVTVTFTLKNTGTIKGMEVAQLYIQDVECSVPRPVKELKGFEKVLLMPGLSTSVSIQLTKQDFSFWNLAIKSWTAEPGKFKIFIGASSTDIRLQSEIELQ
ncbi:glycoside hydrolase family 3 C-terminal domain-containing protein [candidate division KSB1 bacterium]|nr:glycoside hydrolase family 3 C-terminal domain-containing protein [candidate division KSB1 bacterium]